MAKNKHIGFSIGRMDDDDDQEEKPKGNRYPDHVLFQLIETLYRPADNWETCTMPLSMDRMIQSVNDHFPGKFDGRDHIVRILKELHISYEYNEHNSKWYWLVNPA